MADVQYKVLEAGSFELAYKGDDIDTDHTIKFDLTKPDAGEYAVLSFDVNPGNEDDVSVAWKLNDENFLNQTFDLGRDARVWQTVLPKNLLKASGNSLTVNLADDDHKGNISFSNIVLMYMKKP